MSSGEELLQNYSYSEGHKRTWCSKCGGHVFTDHAETYGCIDVYASVLNNFTFIPALHLNYENTILPMKDGLPKFKDFPEDFDWWEPQDKLDGQPAGEYIDEAVYNWFENQ